MKQYSVFFAGRPIEYTPYLKSVAAVRKYLKARFKDQGAGLTFKAIGSDKFYTV